MGAGHFKTVSGEPWAAFASVNQHCLQSLSACVKCAEFLSMCVKCAKFSLPYRSSVVVTCQMSSLCLQ